MCVLQQVLEESPSVLLRPETRRAMQEQAAMLARAVKYRCVLYIPFTFDDEVVSVCVYVYVCSAVGLARICSNATC